MGSGSDRQLLNKGEERRDLRDSILQVLQDRPKEMSDR